nr:phosphotransferase [Kineococcus siccus]
MPVAGGDAWLKACPPPTAHEVRLLPALVRWGVPHVLGPLATEPDRGWLLLPDGGPSVRDTGDDAAWPAALAGCAQLQRATSGHVAELLALGVPDARPAVLADVAADLVDRCAPHLRGVLPRVADEAAELGALGPAPTLQHDDLHPGNVFARGLRLFDWGDACVGHPFASLLVAEREEHRDADRAAYLQGWGPVAPRAVELAVRLAAVSRAASWDRALASVPVPPARFAGAAAQWLSRLRRP